MGVTTLGQQFNRCELEAVPCSPLIGIIIAALVNLFLQSSALQFAISVIGVLVFAGLTAYDTQRIKDGYHELMGDMTATSKAAIMGALSLYLDFINMFMLLLQLFGRRQ